MILKDWLSRQEESKINFIRKYDTQGWSPISNITSIPFVYVKNKIPKYIQNLEFEESFSLLLSKDIKEIMAIPPIDRFRLLIWIDRQYERINKMEQVYLHSEPNFELLAAGIKKLDKFGILNVTAMISREFNYTIEEVEMLPFEKVFDLQLLLKTENEISKTYAEQNKQKK